ncbi:helix-turn-helix domain-containing protein [Bacillus thuringiensis]|uniref:Helix-turn-helix domain-containing protein n=3 Tax=Bacillus thuringiensis TaxID=1428 RepID=A0AB35PM97_BACTU|nr:MULTISPECIES: helix-turn-helix domain-containing protein [Bacillus]MEC3435084.1 helix-turn-helix domain-containing protein [Bacillus cereus]MED1154899.1 helix-turn-helix domain-containing protein [Bacillus paranthracis]AFQ29632.1 putative prophage LambdaBa04, DNA binding protein [Bacillus thuringiensis HD-789]AJH03716.1 DNA binding, excisionase family domain protein [Bacillus thuringiensis HD1002]AND22338.1 DNA-binding protein [Bacillus thuringiensis serovar israelensis]
MPENKEKSVGTGVKKSTIQRALRIAKWAAKQGWSDEEFWEAIELLQSHQEDGQQTTEEKIKGLSVTYEKVNDYPIILNVDHVAQILAVSNSTVYEIMRHKGFPLINIGNRKRVLREEFFNWLKGISAS